MKKTTARLKIINKHHEKFSISFGIFITKMKKKVLQVGIIGPNNALCSSKLYEFGIVLGNKMADEKIVFLSGGKGGFMEAVFRGIKSSEKSFTGQTVAILPENKPEEANDYADIIIPTGMDIARNILIVNSADLLIAAGGGAGTLSELAFAWQKGKTVLCLTGFGGWSEQLAEKSIDERFHHLFIKVSHIEEIVLFLKQYAQKLNL